MHPAALAYLAANMPPDPQAVLEFGSRNVNGTARDLVPTVPHYVGVDIAPGPGADIVGDAATVTVPGLFDVVVCAEVFEHATDEECAGMCRNAHDHLRDGGVFLATMAGPLREPHSAVDGGRLYTGEHYRNVSEQQLEHWLVDAGFTELKTDTHGEDVRCRAVR